MKVSLERPKLPTKVCVLATKKSICYCALFIGLLGSAYAAPRHIELGSLNTDSKQLVLSSMEWGDRYWDAEAKFLRVPTFANSPAPTAGLRFEVRESIWYALGLLLRNQRGDQDRAISIMQSVLDQQFTDESKPWYGTFRRSPEEPDPSISATMWKNYDPNWREFIGTTFAIILTEYPDRIPLAVARRMEQAIHRAVVGEMKQNRLVPSYTNIALMYGFIWDFEGNREHLPTWIAQSNVWIKSVYSLFKKHGSFDEYNSPTYCGVDLYALALWRRYGSTPYIRSLGSGMEASLWLDLASFYNASLRNISGPYDRAYGMDMESYVSVVGLWLRTVLSANLAPLPKLDPPVDHVSDLWFAIPIAVIGTIIPDHAMRDFRGFNGERLVRKQITNQRIATAWIGKNVMYGGEITDKTKCTLPEMQFHPATVQWRTPLGRIGWVQLTHSPLLDVTAMKTGLTISTSGEVHLRIHAEGIKPTQVTRDEWTLPGLTIRVATDAKSFTAAALEEDLDLFYTGVNSMTLAVDPSSDGEKAVGASPKP